MSCLIDTKDSLMAQTVKNLWICLQCGRPRINPWIRKNPLEKGMATTPVFLPEESHGYRSLAGYSPWGCKESDTTERLINTFTFFGWESLTTWWLYHDISCYNSENWPQRNREKWTLELKINCTWSHQDDSGQTTIDQFEDDCQRWLCCFCK